MPEITGHSFPDIQDITINAEGIQKLLSDQSPNKASGPDQIPARILKLCSGELAPILAAFFNQSLESGDLPPDWLMSHITPVYKKGNHSSPSNYRPIALTSICCKILEHVLTSHIMTHFDKYKILNDSQHGFRKRRGCDTQLLLTTNDLANSFYKNKQVDAVLLDFSKAFDRVPHRRLLKKFHHYGITGKIHRWIETFLTKRQQCVVLDGVQSSPVDVDSSVPQGTVIGPLSFLVFINDLPNYISEGTKTRLFADDAFVYREISSQRDIATLQKDLDSLTKWGDEWQMTFNTDKCYTMHFTTKKSPVISDYILCGNQLKSTDVHPYLGIQFSDNLRWKKHILTVTNSCKRTMGVIRRNFKACSVDVKSRLYQSLIQPKLTYGSAAWYPSTKEEEHLLDMIQRSAARLCFNDYSRESSVTQMLEKLEWTSLEDCRRITRLSMMYRITHDLVDIDWKDFLTKPTRPTRRHHPTSYMQIQVKSAPYANSFFPWTIPLWNSLPHDILDITDYQTFKTAIKTHFSSK